MFVRNFEINQFYGRMVTFFNEFCGKTFKILIDYSKKYFLNYDFVFEIIYLELLFYLHKITS